MILIVVPGIPKGKGRPRFRRIGVSVITYTPPQTKKYEDQIRLCAIQAMNGGEPLDGPIEAQMIAYLPIPGSWPKHRREQALSGAVHPQTKPDVDNLLKNLDGINGIAIEDDKQIVKASICKAYSDNPRLEIRISKYY